MKVKEGSLQEPGGYMNDVCINVNIEMDQLGNVGKWPAYQTAEAAAADVAVPTPVVIPPHETVKVDLLLSFGIKEGYQIMMFPRSSLLVKKGIMQPVSIIDSDYTGHVHVPLHNLTNETVYLDKGERVAQIQVMPVYNCTSFEHLNKERGQEGFGTTGETA